jgi:hypothetical protein
VAAGGEEVTKAKEVRISLPLKEYLAMPTFMWDIRNRLNWKTADGKDHLVLPWKNVNTVKKDVYVQLLDTNARRNLELDNSDDDVASVHWEHERDPMNPALIVRARAEGTTTITATQGRDKVKLKVHVFDPGLIQVTYFFVTDDNGRTQQVEASAKAWIDGLNDIYVPQTNVAFGLYRTQNIDLRGEVDFNDILGDDGAEEDFWRTLKHKVRQIEKANGHWNAFMVRLWGGHDIGFDAVGTNRIGKNLAVIEDEAGLGPKVIHTMAHEAGHMLGLPHGTRLDQLMRQASTGNYLLWDEVEQVRDNFD